MVLPTGLLSRYRRYFLHRKVAHEFRDCDSVVRLMGYPWFSYLTKAKYFCYVQTGIDHTLSHIERPQNTITRTYGSLTAKSFRRSGDSVKFAVVSESVRESVKALWQQPSVIIPPPVNVGHYRDVAKRYIDQKAEFKVVSVGRFAREKNHLEQLEIMTSLLQHNPDWRLVMIGSREIESAGTLDELKRIIKERGIERNVSILENATQEEVDRELGTAQYFLHTNHREAFGVSVVEAITAGCIPVVPREGGPGEIVSSELTFSRVPEAVDILKRLSSGWRPSSNVAQDVDCSESAFQHRWIELVRSSRRIVNPD